MLENPRSAAAVAARNKNLRWSVSSDDAAAATIDYPIKCSDKCCRSCAAGMIADSVAICCCPCSVVSFLALALVKAPLMIGRRCLGFGGKNERRREERNKRRICERSSNIINKIAMGSEECMGNGESGISRVEDDEEEGTSEIVFGEEEEEEEEKENLSGRFEAERIWLELHQLGHLGFGRVSSFTGIPSLPKGN